MKKLLTKIPKGVYFTIPDQSIADINKTAAQEIVIESKIPRNKSIT